MVKNIISQDQIEDMEPRFRATLLNSLSGYKSAYLLGSESAAGQPNLALFHSVLHVGADPALMGVLFRPLTVPRHSYNNIRETQCFTLSSVHSEFLEQAHRTSAAFPEGVSEFKEVGFAPAYMDDFPAPFVPDSIVTYALRYEEEHTLLNGTILVVGRVEWFIVPLECVGNDGYADLSQFSTVATLGLDGYTLPPPVKRLPYQRP